tara:strand:- start:20 stop:226 length:207 start_codon:yes stop_codon:yes gene_type:complete
MNYKVEYEYSDMIIYARVDDDNVIRKTCNDEDKDFQKWLFENQDNLPTDIQAKVDSGDLIITDNGGAQ